MSYLDGVDFGSDMIGVGSEHLDGVHDAMDQLEKNRDLVPNPKPRPTQVDAVRAAVGAGGPNWSDVVPPTSEPFHSPVQVGRGAVMIDRDLFNMIIFLVLAVIIFLLMRNNSMEKSQLAMMMNMALLQGRKVAIEQ